LSKKQEDLQRFGYSFSVEDLDGFLADKKKILSTEICVVKEAVSGVSL